MTDITPTLEVRADPTPTAGQRVARTAGQSGGVVVFIELWQAFGWFGADHWTADQAAQRWPAIFAAALLVVAAVHNGVNWWRTDRLQPARPPQAVTVSAVEEAPAKRRR